MAEESGIATVLKTSRDALALVRDLAVLAAIVVLVIAPERTVPTFQDIGRALAKAGFTKLSFAGVEQDLTRFTEKVQEARLDTQLAQEDIADVARQLAQYPSIPPKASAQLANAVALVGRSYDTLAAAEQSAQQSRPASAQPPPGAGARNAAWVIVVGADRELARAEDEVRRATKASFSGAFIIRREGWYRTVIPMESRAAAEARLPAVGKAIRDGGYIRNLASWCTALTASADQRFQECGSS